MDAASVIGLRAGARPRPGDLCVPAHASNVWDRPFHLTGRLRRISEASRKDVLLIITIVGRCTLVITQDGRLGWVHIDAR